MKLCILAAYSGHVTKDNCFDRKCQYNLGLDGHMT